MLGRKGDKHITCNKQRCEQLANFQCKYFEDNLQNLTYSLSKRQPDKFFPLKNSYKFRDIDYVEDFVWDKISSATQ